MNIYSRSGIIKGSKKSEADDVIGSIKVNLDIGKIGQLNQIIDELKRVTNKFAGIYIEFIEKKDGLQKIKILKLK